MTVVLLVRRFVGEYVRNPVNLLFLVVVPIVFVVLAADAMAAAASLLGGAGGGAGIETATAGWAAGFLTAIAMYFQIATARDPDRRLVLSGLQRRQLVSARLAAGAALALLTTTTALAVLLIRGGIAQPGRAVLGTLMFALVYLALGAIVGAWVPDPVNGTVILLFLWIIDIFFGPTLSAANAPVTRVLPTHFVSLWTVDQPASHTGPSEFTWALLWTLGAISVAVTVVLRMTRVGGIRSSAPPGSARSQLRTGLRMAWHEWRRTPVLGLLLIIVPAVFVWLADYVTPAGHTPVTVRENGVTFSQMMDPADMHGGTMVPIAVGSLAALAGLFMVLDARNADQRLALAGQRVWVVLATKLGMIALATGLATMVSLAVTATVFTPRQWLVYAAAVSLAGVTYAFLGVLLGPIFGRVSGTFMAFLIPFLDLGLGQSPMLGGQPRGWAYFLPGYGSMRVMIDGALTSRFDEFARLVIALGWVALLATAAVVYFERTTSVVKGTQATV